MKKQTKKQVEENVIIEQTAKEAAVQMEAIKKEKTVEAIAESFKKEYKDVYITSLAGLQIVWRKLKRSEYKELSTTEFSENEELSFLEKQDFIAKKVILYPENVEELIEEYAGVADIIATETMVKTGFGLSNTTTV